MEFSLSLFLLLYAGSELQLAHRALAIVSVFLISLGLTGVYLWFRLHNERTIGSILLAANLIVSLVLMVTLRS